MQCVLMLALRLCSNQRPGPQAEPPPPRAHRAERRLLLVQQRYAGQSKCCDTQLFLHKNQWSSIRHGPTNDEHSAGKEQEH